MNLMVKGVRLHRSLLRDQAIHEIGERASIPPFLLSTLNRLSGFFALRGRVVLYRLFAGWVSRLQIQTFLVHWKGKRDCKRRRCAASTALQVQRKSADERQSMI